MRIEGIQRAMDSYWTLTHSAHFPYPGLVLPAISHRGKFTKYVKAIAVLTN